MKISRRNPTKAAVIIPAAGIGARLTSAERKAWVSLGGRPLLAYALETFRAHPQVSEIILVVAADDMERARLLLAQGPDRITEKVVVGGDERYQSVWQGLQEITAGTDIVLIHDAARPFISPRAIDACIDAVARYGAAVVAMPMADTLKQATPEGDVAVTVPREGLWAAQTPQGARFDLLQETYARAMAEGWRATDDVAMLERAGHRAHLVEGEAINFKITHPEDLALAERLLEGGMMRVGCGYDVHRLVPERALVLGGVTVPHTHGLLGHSDADVLTHAIMDALLGAAALGDIGGHFPDSAPQYKGISSLKLLAEVGKKVAATGCHIVNIDAIIVAQSPKLAPYMPVMRDGIAAALGLSPAQVSVKATTTEGLGFTGSGEGMAAYATASLRKMC